MAFLACTYNSGWWPTYSMSNSPVNNGILKCKNDWTYERPPESSIASNNRPFEAAGHEELPDIYTEQCEDEF